MKKLKQARILSKFLVYFVDPAVRDSSAEALGTLMKLVGEKAIGPFLVELEKDNLKMTKIRECCDKAVIAVKVASSKKERPTTAPNKSAGEPMKNGSAPKVVKRAPGRVFVFFAKIVHLEKQVLFY